MIRAAVAVAAMGVAGAASCGNGAPRATATDPAQKVPRAPALSVLPSTQVDPGFAWFAERSAESLAEELWAKGYKSVRFTVTSRAGVKPDVVKACKRLGLKAILVVFGNGVYVTADLPSGWKEWRMRLVSAQPNPGYTYLCLNEPRYVEWRQKDTAWMLRRGMFDAVEICEPFWPAHSGPDSPLYGCLCDRCRDRFRIETGLEAPDFDNELSPSFWKTDTACYEKWVDARARWNADFLDQVMNGDNGLRKTCPEVEIGVWGIASRAAGPEQMREWEGVDAAQTVRACRPDAYVIQTDWPDWIEADLPADYVLKYAPYISAAKSADKGIPVLIQTDSGSQKQMRRTLAWLQDCDRAGKRAGSLGVFPYMHSLEMDAYEAGLKLLRVRDLGKTVRLVLNKWPSAEIQDPARWRVSGARIETILRDGCTVVLTLGGRKTGTAVQLSWRPVSDDPSRRFHKDMGPSPWSGRSRVRLAAEPEL